MARRAPPSFHLAGVLLIIVVASNYHAALAAAASPIVSIADPSVCVSNADCPAAQYCVRAASGVSRCQPRAALGANCTATADCVATAFCFVTSQPVCRARAALDAPCNPVQANACRPGLVCAPPSSSACVPAPACDSPLGGRCRPRRPGRAAAPCVNDRDCAQDAGFYCRTSPTDPFKRFCAAKRAPGADCNNRSDNRECRAGFCASGFPAHSGRARRTNGVCAAQQPLGGVCFEARHCARAFFSDGDDNDAVLCNRPRAVRAGRCLRESALLKRLGAPCDREADRCDARRGLACYWAPARGAAVCQQRYDRVNRFRTQEYCTPDSALSACPGRGTECRAERAVPGSPFAQSRDPFLAPSAYARCLPRRATAPAGAACDLEQVVCAEGSSCRVVPNVAVRDGGFRPRFPPQAAAYCVRALREGDACAAADKFRAACADGLACDAASGKCAPSTAGPGSGSSAPTHAFLHASCAELPCAPGLVCDASFKLCKRKDNAPGLQKPTDLALGQRCDSSGECRGALVCRTQWAPYGLTRCQWPAPAGAYCEADAWCKQGLRCPAEGRGVDAAARRCTPAATRPLWSGQQCAPGAAATPGPQCATVQVRDGRETVAQPLACLPGDDGRFKCQIYAMPFEMCGALNVRCGHPLFECRKNVCVPKKEG